MHLHVTSAQPYRGRHSAPDDDELRDAATADSVQTALDPAPDDVAEPALVAVPTESDADGDTTPPVAEAEDATAPRKRKLFALRGGKAR